MDPKLFPEPARTDAAGSGIIEEKPPAQQPPAAPEAAVPDATANAASPTTEPQADAGASESSSPAQAAPYSQAPPPTSSVPASSSPTASSPPSSSSAVSVYKTVPITVPPSDAEPEKASSPEPVTEAELPSEGDFPIEEAPRVRRSGAMRTAAIIVGIIAAGAAIGFVLKSQAPADRDSSPGSSISVMPEPVKHAPVSQTEALAQRPAADPAGSTSAAEPGSAPTASAESTDAPGVASGAPNASTKPPVSTVAAAPRKINAIPPRRSAPAGDGFPGRKVPVPPSAAKKPASTPRNAKPGHELPDKLLF